MTIHWLEMWRFETARFTVVWEVTECDDLDLSWDDDGETRRNLESGFWCAFDSRVRVLLDGREVSADYLGQSIYENPSDFRDHFGIRRTKCGSYFSDMVREAISEARKALCNMPQLRSA